MYKSNTLLLWRNGNYWYRYGLIGTGTHSPPWNLYVLLRTRRELPSPSIRLHLCMTLLEQIVIREGCVVCVVCVCGMCGMCGVCVC